MVSGSLFCDDESEGSETEVVSPMLQPTDDTAEEGDVELQAVSAAVQESIRDTAMSFIYNFFIFKIYCNTTVKTNPFFNIFFLMSHFYII